MQTIISDTGFKAIDEKAILIILKKFYYQELLIKLEILKNRRIELIKNYRTEVYDLDKNIARMKT